MQNRPQLNQSLKKINERLNQKYRPIYFVHLLSGVYPERSTAITSIHCSLYLFPIHPLASF